MELLSVRGISKYFSETDTLANDDISIDISPGELRAVVGENGAGKSTLAKIIAGLLHPDRGEILMRGVPLRTGSVREAEAAGIGYVPQHSLLAPGLSVAENLALGASARLDRAAVPADLERACGYFPRLRERMRQQAGTLSGGEQQMLAVARALMLRPRLLLLDEPSFGLAPLVVDEIFRIFRDIVERERVAILLVEQNAALALALADDACVLETGRVVASGPSATIANDAAVRRAYLGT